MEQLGFGWAFFLENKATSVTELWKEEPKVDQFPVKLFQTHHMDLKELEKDIEMKAEALLGRIEKRRVDDRKKKEKANEVVEMKK